LKTPMKLVFSGGGFAIWQQEPLPRLSVSQSV
jgi:hypothetical protein